MKAHGGTVVCSYGYGISPSSTPLGRRHGRLLRARRRQGGRARHVHPLRLRRDDDAGARGQAEGLQRLLRRPRRQLERRPGDRAASRRASSPRSWSSRPDTSRASSAPRPGRRCRAATSTPSSAPSRCRTPAPSRCSRPSRSTRTSRASEFPNFSQYESWLGRRPHDQGPAAGRATNPTQPASSRPCATSRATTATDCCPRPSTTRPTSARTSPSRAGGT